MIKAIAGKEYPRLRRIFGHLRSAEMGVYPGNVSIFATKKMGKKTRKMGYSLTEIA